MKRHSTIVTRRPLRRGFTLMEAMLTTVIIGVGTVALLTFLAKSTAAGYDSAELTTAINLANNVHELCERLKFTDGHWGMDAGETIATCNSVEDLDGLTLNGANGTGPIDAATRQPIAECTDWAQKITVQSVTSGSITATTQPNATVYPMMRVTVVILHNGRQVYQNGWLVINPN